MLLLTLLAVGLLSLSTISVRSSSQSNAMQAARANARVALTIAIGELQRAVGPDQRVTATADFAGAADGSPISSGEAPRNDTSLDRTAKGLTSFVSGTRHWTGVFVNNDTPDEIYTKTPSARAQRWLVSGAENSGDGDLDVTPAYPDCAVDPAGGVTDPTKAAVLVGENTVGSGNDRDFVAAPLIPIRANADREFYGSYAYWVADEGVKARIDMERENEDPTTYASLPAQRRGWETVEGFENYPPALADADSILPAMASIQTADLVLPVGGGLYPRQLAFHSATTDSMGVLANTLESGLRVDLSTALAGELPTTAPADAYDNYPRAGARVIPRTAFRELQHLKWDHIADFFNRGRQITSDALQVTENSGPDSAAIAPTIVDFRILFGVRMEKEGRGNNYEVSPTAKIAVSLGNPYPVPLEWDQDIELEIKNQTPLGNRPSRIWQINNTCVYIPRDGTLESGGSEKAVLNQAVFRIEKGRLEPGECRAYTIARNVVRPYDSANRRTVVDMAPFTDVSPFDFNRCVEMTTPTTVTLPKTLDVRESWQTTLVALEMRLASRGRGYNWLRRIEGFELDNGYFGPNQRRFDDRNAARLRGPVPMMLYSFQISQPGMNYLQLMPNGYEMGQRASTLRTFADFNLQATNIHAPIASYNPPPYFMESNDSQALLPFEPGGNTGTGFTRNLAFDPVNWGHSSVRGSSKTVLFAVPREFTSMAQLQHADLTSDAVTLSVGHQPGNAFGNSYATPFVRRAQVEQSRTDYVLMGSLNHSGAFQTKRIYYDMAHILNSSLWDRYFFSSIPYGGGIPENPTMVVDPGTQSSQLNNPSTVAASLMVDGAFNIHSTDKNAWKAMLASSKYFKHQAERGDLPDAAFPRSLEQPSASALPPTGMNDDSFGGYRRLTDEEIDLLAEEIVKQVRIRGPFVSLSHFVNRALADFPRERELNRCGALQMALDESGVNISMDGRRNGFKDLDAREERVRLPEKQGAPRADLDGGDLGGRPQDAERGYKDWAVTSRDNNFGAVASILADRDMLSKGGSGRGAQSEMEQGYRSTGIPSWVTQADVLQVIGPAISTRSDTFKVRACGQALDADGNLLASAYCEAVVQRHPEYLDPVDPPEARGGSLSNINQLFGRKFELVSFRWLSPDEI
ncbi:hypothetical protein HAHE_35020 [Haloferula helveola]|uniref:Verru_Chthon cassette protein A n=2 Tax=Haloferula helveola TaxID=490095 RepID=A0ABM7RIM9_9BACT|nr:hypothetical protein HAHE_35020 [Haloferula helveola]